MSDQISYEIEVDVAGQITMAVGRSITVEAYGKIEADVPAKSGGSAGTATLRPLPGAGNTIRFLMITSSVYDAQLKVNQNSTVKAVLSEPVALFGSEAVGHLGITDKDLQLENGTSQEATVQVVVGWDAVA